MTILRLIADDLTGALDSAAQFTDTLGPLPVFLNSKVAPPAGSFVLDLACRDLAEAEAIARTATTAHHLEGADIAFKKIDSLLRGHWAAELAVLAEHGSFRRMMLAPAFPAQGRITLGGRQIVRGGDGASTMVAVDLRAALARHGLDARILSSGAPPASDAPLFLCDAASDADLKRLVESARASPGPTLWCGAAGLALALNDGRPPKPAAPAPGPHLVVIGSNHLVTQQQVLFIARNAPAWVVTYGDDTLASADRIDRTLSHHGRCLCVADLPPGCSRTESANLMALWFAALAPRLTPPTTLTVVGGETFASVCDALRVSVLRVEGEWRAGIPASRSAPGLWAETACFSKSGAFGEPDCLMRLLA